MDHHYYYIKIFFDLKKKNLDNFLTEDGISIKEKYLPYFNDILNRLSEKDKIDYEIRFFYDYQKDPLVKQSLIEVMNNYELLKYTLDPKDGQIRLRFPCPKCGLTEKHLLNTKIEDISNEHIKMKSICPYHGEYSINIDKNSTDLFDMNVPLRYLVKILYLLKKDKEENSLNVIVDGGDWSGIWPLRVYMEPLLKLKHSDVPSIIYTPTILSQLSAPALQSKFYNQYGEVGFQRLYNEINNWILEPKKFIRDYTIEYMDAILNDEKINILQECI